jgi:hypothetical protein
MLSTSSLSSIVLPVFGFMIFLGGIVSGRENADYGHDALLTFIAWILMSICGAGCSIFSLSRYGASKTAIIGLLLCAPPFLFILYIITINSR